MIPQTIHVGIFLLILITYRLIAFWVSVLLESGTDSSRAARKALLDFDPASEAEDPRSYNQEQIIESESGEIIYKWSVRQILWEIVFPNVFASIALVVYFIGCID